MPSGHPFQYPESLELINSINRLLKKNKGEEETLGQLVNIYSNHDEFLMHAGLKITFGQLEFKSKRFIESKNQIENFFSSPDGKKGAILLSLHHDITGNYKKIHKELYWSYDNIIGKLIIMSNKPEKWSFRK